MTISEDINTEYKGYSFSFLNQKKSDHAQRRIQFEIGLYTD